MAIKVLLRDHPSRTLALATSSHALIFRHAGASSNGRFGSATSSRTSLDTNNSPKCIVEFESLESVDLTEFRSLSHQPVFGTLGLITIEGDIFLCVVTACTKVAQVRPGETVQQINAVQFFCLSSSKFDMFSHDNYTDIDPYEMRTDYSHHSSQAMSQRDPQFEHPCADLQKMLSNGSFYYSTDFDLTNRLQDRWDIQPFVTGDTNSVPDPRKPPILTSTTSTTLFSGIHT